MIAPAQKNLSLKKKASTALPFEGVLVLYRARCLPVRRPTWGYQNSAMTYLYTNCLFSMHSNLYSLATWEGDLVEKLTETAQHGLKNQASFPPRYRDS